ncbi:hypothetical protein [uncultured Catenibacterium sp.]|uniref:hypothetical protein n=1 Tax=uncultured Catenibacterium sp. TaxID=286142 RepID=UPI0025F57613|nr:hypothetical protein [uncultured Catenibacterium sp.]
MNTKERIAKVIRVLSVPPIMVSVFILILPFHKKYIFTHVSQIIIMILLLGIISALAYVLSDMIPAIKIKGREGQRKLVFITTLIGYTVSLLWAVITGVNNDLMLICLMYFTSVLLLTICNKGLHFRASGHASSFTGPLILTIYFMGWKVIIPALFIAILIVWSSVYLKRHTLKELAGGMIVSVFAFIISYTLITVL